MLILAQHNSCQQVKLALSDFYSAIRLYRLWTFLAWQEIKQRYHRSLLGPLWLTISQGVLIGAIGPIYSELLKTNLSEFFRTLSIGMVLWGLISGAINDSCNAFISAEGFIKQVRLPYSLYIIKVLAKNFIIFLHNSIIIIIVLIIFPPKSFEQYYLVFFGLIILYINLFWIGLVAALLCTRFRDIAQLISNVLQLLFFVTPIMWPLELLGGRAYVVEYNIFYYFIEIVRAPLTDTSLHFFTWLIPICTAIFGFIGALLLFSKYRSRIIYWI
jgi:ABC-type polysaccharide/polyol phosphate export permease